MLISSLFCLLLSGSELVLKTVSTQVQKGESIEVQVLCHSDTARIVTAEVVIQHSSGLSFQGLIQESDFDVFVAKANTYDQESRTIRWVQGQISPGHGGKAIRCLTLKFKAEELGTQTLNILNGDEDSRLFVLGEQPKNDLSSVENLTLEIREEKVQKWAFPSSAAGSTALNMVVVNGPNASQIQPQIMDANGQKVTTLPSISLEPHQVKAIDTSAWSANEQEWVLIESSAISGGMGWVEIDQDIMFSYPLVPYQSSLIVPHIAENTAQFATQIHLTASEGDLLFQYGESWKKFENQPDVFKWLVNSDFSKVTPKWGQFLGPKGIFGMEQFGRVDESAPQRVALGLDNSSGKEIIFTHVAKNLSVFWTGMVINNLHRNPNPITLTAYNAAGQATNLPQVELGPLEKVTVLFQADAEGNPNTISNPNKGLNLPGDTEWVRVQAEKSVTGYTLFGDRDNRFMAGFEGVREGSKRLTYPYVMQGEDRFTGFALVNTSDSAQTLQVDVRNLAGETIHNFSISLNPFEKRIALHSLFFDGNPLAAEANSIAVGCENNALAGFQLMGDLNERKMLAGALAIQE